MSRVERVLIVGAGLAGAALACVLRRSRTSVDLIEQRPAPKSEGAGVLLPGNALRVLDALGIGVDVRRSGFPVNLVRFTDERGDLLFQVDCKSEASWPDFVSIHRSRLHDALLRGARPIVPRYGCTVEELRQGDFGVRVRLSDRCEADYDLVVGADGLHSQTRLKIFGPTAGEPIPGFHGWRFVTRRPESLTCPQYMLGMGRTFLLHPLGGDEVYCGAGPVLESHGAPREPDLHQLRAEFFDFAGPAREVLDHLDCTTPLLPTRYWQIRQSSWRQGRCLLIGDAAHACAPTLAQGAAMAFEDALVLGQVLGDDHELESALMSFEQRRRPRVALVQRESRMRMEANRMTEPREIRLRNALLQKVGAPRLTDIWGRLMDEPP